MDPYIAEIRMFGGNFAPKGWLFCNGQLLPINQYTALFSLLGVTYGGDGQSTFGLPNLQGRVPMHFGNGPGLTPHTLGESSGTETVTLSQGQMPMHNHTVAVAATSGTQPSPAGAFIAQVVDENLASYNAFVESGQNNFLNPASVSMAGGNQAHANMQPYLCVSFIIATEGIYPPRP